MWDFDDVQSAEITSDPLVLWCLSLFWLLLIQMQDYGKQNCCQAKTKMVTLSEPLH